ncbi:MAG: hypothetical protein ACR2F2_00130 [Pyrinomonadaceae bacterium]
MSLLTTLIGAKHQKELIALQEKLHKATKLLQAKNEIEALDTALEKIIEEFEMKEESDEINDVFDLEYVKPKRTYEIEAEFEFAGRGKPLPFDFSDVNFDDEE